MGAQYHAKLMRLRRHAEQLNAQFRAELIEIRLLYQQIDDHESAAQSVALPYTASRDDPQRYNRMREALRQSEQDARRELIELQEELDSAEYKYRRWQARQLKSRRRLEQAIAQRARSEQLRLRQEEDEEARGRRDRVARAGRGQ